MFNSKTKMPLAASSRHKKRPGVILLVVLGMLTLFSMLGVSYLVFTSRQRAAAFSISRAESTKVDSVALLDDALAAILVGSTDPTSSLWGHDLLGDLYGMRDSVRGKVALPSQFVSVTAADLPEVSPATLLDRSFLRFATDLHLPIPTGPNTYDRYPYRRYEGATASPNERQYPGGTSSHDYFPIDDELTGRLLTFNSGPLGGLTMPIVRYFGDHLATTTNSRSLLSGQMIVDIRRYAMTQIEIDGESRSLAEWIANPPYANFAHRLIYDSTINTGNFASVSPYDEGLFYINGRILNGPGIGWDVQRNAALIPTNTNFNLNDVVSTGLDIVNGPLNGPNTQVTGLPFATGGTDVPIALQGNYSIYRTPRNRTASSYDQDLPPGDIDEPYDAADYNNLWLSYFPDNAALGVGSPSFVRPEILNWLINFNTGSTDPSPVVRLANLPVTRLQSILYAIQRSTLRPIPFYTHNLTDPTKPIGDPRIPENPAARGPGVLRLSYENFTGSNESVGLNSPIDMRNTSGSAAMYYAQRVYDLATALAGRDEDGDGFIDSWDVDNDGDGHVDSVWTDAGMPLTSTPDGQLVKPLVAYLIEDMGGRVNANLAGNLAQGRQFNYFGTPRDIINTEMSGGVQHANPVQIPASDATKSPVVDASATAPNNINRVTNLPNGFGYGPAEIDVRALFGATYGTDTTRLFRGPQALVRNRLNVTTYSSIDYIAAGEFVDPLTSTPTLANGNDILGVLRNPTRPNLHLFNQLQGLPNHPQGYPVDTFGRTSIGLGIEGGLAVSRGGLNVSISGGQAGDANDDPYEFRLDANGSQPDNPYSFEDLEGLLRFSELDRDLLGSRLVELINRYHENPAAAPDQLEALRRSIAEALTTHSNSATGLVGTLPSEWRDSAHLVAITSPPEPPVAGPTTATSPQRIFTEVLRDANPSMSSGRYFNALLWQLFPPEVLGGSKFDLNRPFGDGFDNDGDGVIDDPQEVAAGNEVYLRQWDGSNPQLTRWSSNLGDVTPGTPGLDSRGFFAQQLYTLAMFLLRDSSGTTLADFNFPGNPPASFVPLPGIYALTFQQEYRAWKIAQWAVNVADYRDPDAIMTRFNYDPNPFDGWDIVDSTTPPIVPQSYRTVWGMENPELTLEESLAFHDRRVRDTTLDSTGQRRLSGGTFQDDDLDQWRIPQGSLFLEVKSTRPPQRPTAQTSEGDGIANPAAYPNELFTNIGTAAAPNYVLDLGREAPDQNPVWRVAISESHDALVGTNLDLCPDFLLQPVGSGNYTTLGAQLDRETATLQPEKPAFFAPTKTTRVVDRVIWFTSRNPDAPPSATATDGDGSVDFAVPSDSNNPAQIFYNRIAPSSYTNGGTYLSGGEYAVIGPRQITAFGGLDTHATAGPTHDVATEAPQVPYNQYESPQQIELNANFIEYRGIAGQRKTPLADLGGTANASIRPAVGIIAAANPPSGGAVLGSVGINVSEPLPWFTPTATQRYYFLPTEPLNTGFPIDSWYNFNTSAGALYDEPFDGRPWSELARTLDPTSTGIAQVTGTHEQYKTAYLQRLADPTQAYNATTNPYMTVDYISIDLTVFNGSDSNTQIMDSTPTTQWKDPSDPDPFAATTLREKLATRYKTGHTIDQDPTLTSFPNLAHSVTTIALQNSTVTANAGGHTAFFNHELVQDPALDPAQGGNIDNGNVASRAVSSATLGYANHSYGSRWTQGAGASATAALTPFIGAPYDQFMIGSAWMNRPFVSPGELIWVPTTSAGRFASQFSVATLDANYPSGANPYDDANNTYSAPLAPRYDLNQQFPHLWNYFSSNANAFSTSPNFYRLLEFVETPPPYDFEADFISPDTNIFNPPADPAFGPNFNYNAFGPAGTVTGNPDTWVSAGGSGFWTNQVPTEFLRPPFSFRSGPYRNGLINLNTIRSNQVYGALSYGFSTDSERAIVYGRTALGAPGGPLQAGFGALRDAFLDSRRGYAMSTIPAAPATIAQLRPGLDHRFPTQFAGVFETANGADIAPDLGTSTNLRRTPISSTLLRKHLTLNQPLLQRTVASTGPAQSPERSVAHQTLGMTRLANLTSGQSNVYAIWITVGMFEVDANTLTVGQEVGFDTGQAKRFRSFQIIDRSVPVRYEPGVQNNAMDVVQLSRVLD